MGISIFNNKAGWSREVTEYPDGSRYICDSTIRDGEYVYHEYNITSDNSRHSHIYFDGSNYYGHEEDERDWRD